MRAPTGTPVLGPAASAFGLQLAVVRRSPGDLLMFLTAPLLTVVFLAIARHAGRTDLESSAVLAPVVMELWSTAVFVSGGIIDRERSGGTLELLVASPVALPLVVVARIAAVTLVSLLTLVEVAAVARLGFGVEVTVPHPVLFVATMALTALATAGWATVMSGVFVLARSARVFQNALSYPFYILGGVVVPVALLPDWLHPVTDWVYLSWATDLLRSCTSPQPVPDAALRLCVLAALGGAGYLVGAALMYSTVHRVRRTGSVNHG